MGVGSTRGGLTMSKSVGGSGALRNNDDEGGDHSRRPGPSDSPDAADGGRRRDLGESRRSRSLPCPAAVLLSATLAASPSGADGCEGYAGGQDEAAVFWGAISESELRPCIAALGVDARDGEFGATPLHWAATYANHPSVIAALVEAGSDVEARDEDKWTPLHVAAIYGNPTVVVALLDAGADLTARGQNGWTPLHVVAVARNDNSAMVAVLVEAGGDVEAGDEDDWTPLHVAALNGNFVMIDALIEAGADPDAVTEHGRTPCDVAGRRELSLEEMSAYERLCNFEGD